MRVQLLGGLTHERTWNVMDNTLMSTDSATERIATATAMMGRYLLLLFFPYRLSSDYSFRQIPVTGFSGIEFILSLIAVFALLFFAVLGIKKKDPASFGVVYFFISLALVSNFFFYVGATMAERFLYNPLLGFCISIGFLLVKVFKPLPAKNPAVALKSFSSINFFLLQSPPSCFCIL